ncbi:MAG: tetratricopeptide repeat protein [Acidobacteria bacterium]|nr:tetratricopeptide repeat protein [Acidobacteriota bacterium]
MRRAGGGWALVALFAGYAGASQMDAPATPGPPDSALVDSDVVVDGTLSPAGIDPALRASIDAALQARDYTRAETLLLEAVQAQPQSAEALRLLGGVFFLRGRPLNAAVAYKKAEALAPLDERSRFTLTMSYVALGRRDWARPELETLLETSPRNPLYIYWIARLDYDDGQFEAAVERLLRVVALDPGFMRAWDNLGLNYDALGRFDDAVRSYEEALRLNRLSETPSPWPALNLGILLVKLDRLAEAEARFRESVAADPGFPPAHYQLGLLLDNTGRPEEAIPELEEAARLDAEYAEPHFALARLYRRAGDKDRARQALERFQEIKKREEQQPRPPSS